MDVIEIDGASNTSVNDVRQIKDEVLFPPQAGRCKVYIIDEVHMLSNSAFNALLKTIEEPPPYIVFVFATTELHKVPATIKSRCQQFNFRLIPIETIQEILKGICGEMGIEAEAEALFWIARESTGSLRDAFTLFDQVASFSGGHIKSDLIREKLGLVGLEKLNALAESCAANDTPGVFALTDEILSSGIAIEQFVIDLAGYYRSLLLLKNGVERESLLGYSPHLFSAKALETFDSIRLEQALEILLDCYRDIRYTVSPRFELETAVSKLSWLSRWVSPPELKAAMDQAQGALRSHGVGGVQGLRSGTAASMPDAAGEGTGRPLAGGLEPPVNQAEPWPLPAAGNGSGAAGEGRSLAEDFKRKLTARAASSGDDNIESSANGDAGQNDVFAAGDDEDVPLWDEIVQNKSADVSSADAAAPDAPGADANAPELERLLRLIPGTVVSPESVTIGAGHEYQSL
jgi:DNA polymerase-3 subunit gamma/tau